MARVWAEMSLPEYNDLPGIPMWIDIDEPTLAKSDILVLYRRANLIQPVVEDAAARKRK